MDDREIITLYDEDGQESEFEILAVINVEDNDYAILVPEDDDSEQAYIFRIDNDDKGDEVLSEVEDDEEFQLVKEAWEVLCDEGFYDDYDEDSE